MSKDTASKFFPLFHRDGKVYIIDDIIETPDEIKNMSDEEMDMEIKRLEEEGRIERDKIRERKKILV